MLEDRLAPAVATINVTSTAATPNYPDTTVTPAMLAGQNNVTLIDAINAANNFGQQAPGNSTTINLQNATYTFTSVPTTTSANVTTTTPYWWYGPDALPAIASTVTVNGNGAVLRRDPASTLDFRFFYVSDGQSGLPAGNLTLRGLTLEDGFARGGNGFGDGGGGNGLGGALFNLDGTVTLTDATLAGNSAVAGPGGGTTGTAGAAAGADVYNLAYGHQDFSGGAFTATAALSNTILASTAGGPALVNQQFTSGNTPGGLSQNSGNTATVSGTNNLIVASVSDQGSAADTLAGTIHGDPHFLSALPQDNGGLTPTLAIDQTSPAFNAGNNAAVPAGLSFDQRGPGFARVVNGTVDIGAFEVQVLTVPPLALAPPPAPVPGVTLSLPLLAEGASSPALVLAGPGFGPGSLVLVNGRAVTATALGGGRLLVPDLLEQYVAALAAAGRKHRHHPRPAPAAGEGALVLVVVTPGAGRSAVVLPVVEAVAPGDAGTAAERVFAELYERHTGREADTAPQFQAFLHRLRRLDI